ncbi:monocarboxylate transporter 12-like [Ptychodera flava]|uniref:monocarboxylate transporter 12-like n=1 Tax=Ptychodera flava TaxID=63121 RepID=UPI00396A0899
MAKCQPCDSGEWRWLILASTFYIQFVCAGIMSTNGIFMVEFLRYFDEGATAISRMFTLQFLVGAIISPIVGYLTSVYGARKVVAAGAILHTVAMVTTAFSDSLLHLTVTFAIVPSISTLMIYLPPMSVIAEHFTDRYALANGIAWVGGGVGTLAFPPMVEALIQVYGWHGSFLIIAGLFANTFACAMTMKPASATSPSGSEVSSDLALNETPGSENAMTDDQCDTKRTPNREGYAPIGVSEKKPRASPIAVDDQQMTRTEQFDTKRTGNREGYAPIGDSETKPTATSLAAVHDQQVTNKTGRGNICLVISRMWGLYILPRYPRVTILVVCMAGFGIAMLAYLVWIVVRAVDIGIPGMKAAMLMTIFGIHSVIGRIGHGWFVDFQLITPMSLLALVLNLSLICASIYTFTTNYVIMAIACAGLGLSQGAVLPMFVVCAKEVVLIEDLPNVIGLIFCVQGVFGGIFMTLAGK